MDLPKTKLHFQRFEFKYLMDELKAQRVLQALLANNLDFDPYTEGKTDHAYTVTSLYYESPELKCYQEKISGLQNRFKLRERIYEREFKNDLPIFYEIKKKNDAVIIKDRKLNSPSSDFNFLRARYNLMPRLLVSYKRQALQGKFQERLRVTFDSAISATETRSLKDFGALRSVASGLVVMEVKYNNTLPGWFLRTIEGYELERQPFSKYCVGVESCSRMLLGAGLSRSVDQMVVKQNLAVPVF